MTKVLATYTAPLDLVAVSSRPRSIHTDVRVCNVQTQPQHHLQLCSKQWPPASPLLAKIVSPMPLRCPVVWPSAALGPLSCSVQVVATLSRAAELSSRAPHYAWSRTCACLPSQSLLDIPFPGGPPLIMLLTSDLFIFLCSASHFLVFH